MHIQQLLLLSTINFLVQAGPARRDCGVTKTFSADNACGEYYGGTWVECESGITAMPTFLMPSCSIAASANATSTLDGPVITPAPTLSVAQSGNGTDACQDLWVCVDKIAVCGEDVGKRYGSCYNTCTGTEEVNTSSCTVPPNTTSAGGPESSEPPRETLPVCSTKPWMCAPKEW